MTNSMIKYQTTFEATKNLPMVITLGHGENANLVASFKDGGIDVALSGYTARAIYQPKSKWGTDEWYECPCEIVDNTVIAHWGNTYDNGDDAVKLFMHLVKDGKLAYPAIYQIRLFETPGFSPSTIEPIPETIDFAEYQLENAPWALQSDFNTLSGNVLYKSDIATSIAGVTDDEVLGAATAVDFIQTIEYDLHTQIDEKADISDISQLEDVMEWELSKKADSSSVSTLSTQVNTVASNIQYRYESATGRAIGTPLQNRVVYGVSTPSDLSLTLPSMIVSPDRYTTYIIDLTVDVKNQNQNPYDPESTITFTPIPGKDEFGEDEFEFAVDKGESFEDMMKIEGGEMARYYFTQTGIYHNGLFLIHVSKKVIEAVNP